MPDTRYATLYQGMPYSTACMQRAERLLDCRCDVRREWRLVRALRSPTSTGQLGAPRVLPRPKYSYSPTNAHSPGKKKLRWPQKSLRLLFGLLSIASVFGWRSLVSTSSTDTIETSTSRITRAICKASSRSIRIDE